MKYIDYKVHTFVKKDNLIEPNPILPQFIKKRQYSMPSRTILCPFVSFSF